MKVGPQIYGHSDGRFEARYRKGRKPDGSVLFCAVCRLDLRACENVIPNTNIERNQ